MRDKILNGQLERSDCDSDKVYKFLKLLKRPNNNTNSSRSIEYVTAKDWEREVKRSKKNSILSIFSNRTYAVYKCAFNCGRMTVILVAVLNLFIRELYYPKR